MIVVAMGYGLDYYAATNLRYHLTNGMISFKLMDVISIICWNFNYFTY